jgi:S-DNA-T family DNA segregation ATPase FtsK/SpoIIIE
VLADHAADVWGVIALTAAVLGGLALYGDALGPVGVGVRDVGDRLLGVGRFLVPPALVVGGVRLVAGRRGRSTRSWVGACLVLVAVAGLADLAGGAPRLSASSARLASAGGWVGALVGDPLRAGLAAWGAAVVLVAVAVVALVVLTGVTLRDVGVAVAATVGRVDARWRERRAVRIDGAVDEPLDPLADGGLAPSSGRVRRAVGDELVHREDLGALEPVGDVWDDLDVEAAGVGDAAGATMAVPAGDEQAATAAVVPQAPGTSEPDGGADAAQGAGAGEPAGVLADAMPVAAPPGDWRLPPLSLLRRSEHQPYDEGDVVAAGRSLVAALAAHGVETRLVGYTVGPTVTRFELELGAGVKVARVTSLSKDIAYAMASPDVRILAPIPGKSAIGVEVPNRRRELVTLGDVLATDEARRERQPLAVALGRDIAGRPVMADLATMPHILISGATGAGKSSCINSIITSILVRSTPDQVRLILIDPKRVELGQYNGLPHLLTEVVVDPKKAANALAWAVKEMERRYDLLAEVGMRDITGYNEAIDRGDLGGEGVGADTGEGVGAPDGGAGGAIGVGEAGDGRGVEDRALDRAGDGATTAGGAGRGVAERSGGEVAPVATPGVAGAAVASGAGASAGVSASGPGGEPGSTRSRVPELMAESRRAVAPAARTYQRLPLVLVVVDELGDLMMVAARDVEESVCRIAQMARAVGIHLVLATQRPSVDVITGVIKANVPSRLAFAVSSLADSRVILDQPGAERLVGKGDMLLLTASSSIPRRIQGPWVSEEEVRQITAHWRRQRQPQYVDGVAGGDGTLGAAAAAEDDDDLLDAAMDLVVRSQLGSTSMLQRKLRVGFARAGRLMDLLEQRGVVGPSEGSKARAVLMTPQELDELRGA